MTKITIAYAPDLNVLPLTLVSMASVLKNSHPNDEITFVILHAGLSAQHLKTLENLQQIKPYQLRLFTVNENIFTGFPCPNWVTNEAWFRCLLAEFLPNEDTVLYLDCDTIVRHPLTELFTKDLGDSLAGVIEDISRSQTNAARIGLKDNFYFNSGVLLINLKAWRRVNFFNTLKNIVLTDKKITNDQDALNKVMDQKKYRLSPTYDYMSVWWRKNTPEYTPEQLAEFNHIKTDPIIVHFTGLKPHHPKCKNEFRREYLHYAEMLPDYAALIAKTGIKKTGKGQTKLPFAKRLLSVETSTDRKHRYIHILGLTLKLQIKN